MVWNKETYYELDQHKLEGIQWHATKLVPWSYIDQLTMLNLPSQVIDDRKGGVVGLQPHHDFVSTA